MRVLLLLCSLLFCALAKSQVSPVPVVPAVDCARDGKLATALFPPDFDSLYHVSSLCDSSKDFELRFFHYGMGCVQEALFLQITSGNWNATAFSFNSCAPYTFPDSAMNIDSGRLLIAHPVPACGFDAFWKALVLEHVLEQPLPALPRDVYQGPVCGARYTIVLKDGDRLKKYYLSNTSAFAQRYPQVSAFRQQDAIVRLLCGLIETMYSKQEPNTARQ